jgi:hypothetical protein
VLRTSFTRRHLLGGGAAITTLLASQKVARAQSQSAVVPPRPARERLEEALTRIGDSNGEGARTCLKVYLQAARAAADAADARARAGVTLGPLDGVIVSIKDLFDVAGEPTRAGSKILADAPPAAADAAVVRRLRAAGAVIIAKTNMSEFAFTGLGINPHYGTPGNPADRAQIPGGSSAGAASVERLAVGPVLLAKIVLALTRGIEEGLLMLAQKPGDFLLAVFFGRRYDCRNTSRGCCSGYGTHSYCCCGLQRRFGPVR